MHFINRGKRKRIFLFIYQRIRCRRRWSGKEGEGGEGMEGRD